MLTAAARAAGFTGSGTNTVTGPDSNALTSLQINLGNSNDTANVRSFSKPTTLTTGAGNDTINVSSTSLTGNLNGIGANLTIDAGTGANTLNVSDYTAISGNQNVVVGNSSITGFAGPTDGATINYAATGGTFSLLRVLGSNTPTLAQTFTVNNPNASLFQLNADNGTNAINVEAISGTASIVGGLGKDNIVVSSKPDLTGSLDNIKGTLNIDGGQGVNTLTVSDAGTAGPANNAVITATQITGFAGANNDQTITYKAIGGSFGQIHLIGANNASLDDHFTVNNPNGPLVLDTGAGDDVVNVQALTKAATINGGAGDDTFNVSSDAPANLGTLNGINGGLTVNAGSGSNVLDVSDYGQTSLTDNVTVTPTAITGFAGAVQGDGHQLRRDVQQRRPERVQRQRRHVHRVGQHGGRAPGQRRQRHVQPGRRCRRQEHRRRRRHGHPELRRVHGQRQRDPGRLFKRQRLPEQRRHRPQRGLRGHRRADRG